MSKTTILSAKTSPILRSKCYTQSSILTERSLKRFVKLFKNSYHRPFLFEFQSSFRGIKSSDKFLIKRLCPASETQWALSSRQTFQTLSEAFFSQFVLEVTRPSFAAPVRASTGRARALCLAGRHRRWPRTRQTGRPGS